jgi:hypothetical protein
MPNRFKNPGVIAQGMLAPSGYLNTPIDPVVQSTTRPAGTLLRSSPGYDSIRIGKNRFQGKGPTGGFRPQQFAEDVGGTGAALSVIPGQTAANEATEWLPEDQDSFPEGSMIIADRPSGGIFGGFAQVMHEGLGTIPDMGDRHPGRPLSQSRWLRNPINMFRADYRESPAITVAATVALVIGLGYIANDAEQRYRSRSSGVVPAVTHVPSAAVGTGGDAANDAVKTVTDAADKAVTKIEEATNRSVQKIESTVNTTTS